MSWGTSLLALLVGILGVMNTMLMTVFERTHEICVSCSRWVGRAGALFEWSFTNLLCLDSSVGLSV